MKIKSKIVPNKIKDFLVSQPETGMGYQVVTVFTNNGDAFEKVLITNATEIESINGNPDIPFNAFDIVRVELTHDKS